MVKKIRKPLALFLALVMCLGMVNFTALANETAGHEHNADGWTCTQAEPVKTLNCEEDHEHTDDCYTVTEGEWTCTAPVVVEETPAEVTTFLNAVAGIPEIITPDNAAEVAEYVYGPVSEAYEALLDTELMERADVQEAEAVYAAAIDAVDAALDMESETLVSVRPYDKVFPNGVIGYAENGDQYGSKTVTAGGTATFTTLPERIVGGNYKLPGLYYADQYYYKLKSYSDPQNILDEVKVGLCVSRRADGGTWYGFQTDLVTKEGSSGTATVKILLVYYVSELRGQLIQTGEYLTGYFSRELNYTVTVNGSGVEKPWNKPVVNSATKVYLKCTSYPDSDPESDSNGAHALWDTLAHLSGCYSFGPIEPNDGADSRAPADESPWMCVLTLNNSKLLQLYNNFKGYFDNKTHVLAYPDEAVTLRYYYDKDGWYSFRADSPLVFWVAESIPTYTVTYTDGVEGKTVFADQDYTGLKAGDETPEFAGGDPTSYTDDAGNTYTFQGWSPAVKDTVDPAMANANGKIIYTATWQKDTPNLKVEKTAVVKDPNGNIRFDGARPGDTIVYQITVTNLGSTEVKNVVITDKLDSNLEFVSASGPNKIYLVGAANKPANDQYAIGNLAAVNESNSTKTLTITATVKDGATGTITNTATADCDGMPADNKPSGSADVTIPNPKLTKLEKVRLTAAPAGVTLDLKGKTVNYDQNVVFVGDNAPAVTLLYKITVTGTEGAKYKVIDNGATWVGGDQLTGTLGESGKAVIYVTMDFTKANVENGKLVNNATLESNDPVTPENPGGTEGPTNGGATGEAGAEKKHTVTINFKTDGDETLKASDKYEVEEGGNFNYGGVERPQARKARANSDVTVVMIPQAITGADGKNYSLDEVASAAGLKKLAEAKNITADVVADIIYSLDEKGAIGTDSEGKPTDGSDGIPDKYQVKVTFEVKNGEWNNGGKADVVKYVVKYAEDGETMDKNGTATLGNIIPAVGEKPDQGYEAGSWNTTPTAETTVTDETTYTYTYNKTVVIIPEYKVTVDPANGEEKTVTTVKENGEFTVPAAPTAPEGKEFDGWKGSDGKDYKPGDTITVTGNLTLTAQWKDKVIPEPEKITVTWKSGYGENETLKTGEYDKGTATVPAADYPAAPSRSGYTFTGWSNPVADADGNLTITAQWTQNTRPVEPDPEPDYYTLTIRYVYADGTTARPTVTRRNLEQGDRYSVTSPVIEGYTADLPVVEGTMPARNETVTVTYTAEEDVNETEPPLVETPDVTETPDEAEDLGDDDTPLTELPDETEPPVEPTETPDETEDLGDNDTPLAEVPQTGDSIGLWIVLTLCSAAGLYCFFPKKKKGQREA